MLFIHQHDGSALDFSYHETDVGAHTNNTRNVCAPAFDSSQNNVVVRSRQIIWHVFTYVLRYEEFLQWLNAKPSSV